MASAPAGLTGRNNVTRSVPGPLDPSPRVEARGNQWEYKLFGGLETRLPRQHCGWGQDRSTAPERALECRLILLGRRTVPALQSFFREL